MTELYSNRLRRRRLQNYLLVWVDATIDESSSDCQHALQQLRTVVNDVTVFTETDACIRFLESVKDETVFLIVSRALNDELAPRIRFMGRVDTIFVFDNEQTSRSEGWSEECFKSKGDSIRIETIAEALQQSVNQCNQDSTPISFIPPTTDGATPNLNELEPSFMYTQLLKNAFLDMNHEQQAFDDFVKYCREQKADYPSDIPSTERRVLH